MFKRAVVTKPVSEGDHPLWADVRSLLERGAVLPFISNGMLAAVLGGN